MARSISDIHDFISFIERKERGAFTTPAEVDMLLDAGQLEVFEDYFKYYGQTQIIHDALNPFKVNYQFLSAADGTVTLPSNYMHLLPSAFTVSGSTVNNVRFVNENDWVNAITSQLRPVSITKPIAKDYGSGFNLYPQSQQTGICTYLRRPATPVYAYTQVGRVVTYNPSASTQIEFEDAYIDKIIAKVLGYLGINLNETDIAQFGLLKDQQQ